MPDASGNLSPAESQTALTWLNIHWQNQACPFHGPTKWEVGQVIMTLPYSGGGVSLGGPTYPLLVVTCTQCGHTVLVNAIVAGVVPRPEQPARPEEQPQQTPTPEQGPTPHPADQAHGSSEP
jgi:hypothetical protein